MSTEGFAVAVAEPVNGQGPSKPNRRGAGRKSTEESRAEEFRHRLTIWRQLPESSRPSLRALARELGTTHQMLGYCLDGLEIWQARKDQRRTEEEYKRKADEIRARAEAERRPMTEWEREHTNSWSKKRFRSQISLAVLDQLWRIKREADRGPLASEQIEILKIIARDGYPGAQGLLEKCSRRKVERKRGAEKDPTEVRLWKLISRFEAMDGILLLDDGGQVLYFVQNKGTDSRALLAELWEHREKVKQIMVDCVKRLTEQKYEKLKAEICQRIPLEQLKPLDQLRDMEATPQRA